MALTVSFSTSQPVGDAATITIEDTSTGSDGAVVARRVYLQKYDGDYLVPDDTETDYIEWDYADDSISIEVLDKDYALNVIILWVDTNGTTLYTDSEKIGFVQFNEEFDYNLTQRFAGNPILVNDGRYYELKSQLRTYIDSGNQAISLVGDLYNAQGCYDLATAIRRNAGSLFSSSFN